MNVVIAGGGRAGCFVASMLARRGDRVRLVEVREARSAMLERELPPGVLVRGNAADPAVLDAAGVRSAQVLAAVTDDDETNLVITSLARFEFGVPRTIARVNEPGHAWLFSPVMGVDVALNQAEIMGLLIAEEMSLGDMMTLAKLRQGSYSIVEEKVDPASSAADRSVADIGFPVDCVLATIIRRGHLLIPQAGTVLQAGDEVLAIVHANSLARFSTLLGSAAGGAG
jgi:trk system potassium uptake protein TrkA